MGEKDRERIVRWCAEGMEGQEGEGWNEPAGLKLYRRIDLSEEHEAKRGDEGDHERCQAERIDE